MISSVILDGYWILEIGHSKSKVIDRYWILEIGHSKSKIVDRYWTLEIGHSKSILFMELTWLFLKNIFSDFQKKLPFCSSPIAYQSFAEYSNL